MQRNPVSSSLIEWSASLKAAGAAASRRPHNLPAIVHYQHVGFDIEGTLRAHYRHRNGEL